MHFSDNDNQLINKMKTEAPEFYDLFMRTCNIYECQASSASHDILNHITVLHGTLQVLEHRSNDIKHDPVWMNFSKALHSLIDYINTTSEFRYARHCNKSYFDILDILWNIPLNLDDMFETIGETHSRNYRLDFPEQFPLVYADCDRINSALLAIARNAVEATDEGDDIIISASLDANVLSVVVTDYGCGFSEDALSHVFHAFESEKTGHAGVGLAMARSVASAHGGSVSITPLATGTSVTFSFRI